MGNFYVSIHLLMKKAKGNSTTHILKTDPSPLSAVSEEKFCQRIYYRPRRQ